MLLDGSSAQQLCITDIEFGVLPEITMEGGFGKEEREETRKQTQEPQYSSQQQHQTYRKSSASPPPNSYGELRNTVDQGIPESKSTDNMMVFEQPPFPHQQPEGGSSSYLPSEVVPLGLSEPFPPEQQLETSVSDFSALRAFAPSPERMIAVGASSGNQDLTNAAPMPWHGGAGIQAKTKTKGVDASYARQLHSEEINQYQGGYPSASVSLPQQPQQQHMRVPPASPGSQFDQSRVWSQGTEGATQASRSPTMQSRPSGSHDTSTMPCAGNRGMVPLDDRYNMSSAMASILPPASLSSMGPPTSAGHRPDGSSLQQQEQELRMAQRELHIMQQQAIISQQIQQLQQLQCQIGPGAPAAMHETREAFNPPGFQNVASHGGPGQHPGSFPMPGPYTPSMLAAATAAASTSASVPGMQTTTPGSSWDGAAAGAYPYTMQRPSMGGSCGSTVSSSSSTGGIKKTAPKGPWKVDPASAFLKKRRNDKNRPKRPLSAYNLFFKDERAKMVAASRAERAATCGGGETARTGESTDSATGGPAKKVKQRSGVAFVTMAQTIAARWKAVDSKVLEEYKEIAARDMERYRKEMEEYKAKKAEEKKKESEAKHSSASSSS